MNVYTAVVEFAVPVIGKRIHVGDTVGKTESRVACLIDGVEYSNLALFDWIGSDNSLLFVSLTGNVPDPSSGGSSSGIGWTQAVSQGASTVTVTGLGLAETPVAVLVTINKPDGNGSNIFATVRQDSVSTDGFVVDLSSAIPGAGYKLAYFIVEA
jgi:hypothetical protein